ncbi:carboxymuconolactone decarboxylase family protein [Microbacterium yannicii]|uniref:carboxymuconolactone decarboxylase family protein n=1 Tax=Microbacterium yannicii TaxID=671622 RepID=UPI0002FE0DB1|nr:carboxymuconolactone decarboxylase family protein [Microbacterium yannicii]
MADANTRSAYPAVFQAMRGFSAAAAKAAAEAGIEPRLVELVKLRTSQINGCAYCLRLHAKDAAALGETPERLAVLAAWWESQYFTPKERAALQLTEQVTLISDHGKAVSRGIAVTDFLTEDEIEAVTWMTIVLNSWNRVAVSSHYPVGPTD